MIIALIPLLFAIGGVGHPSTRLSCDSVAHCVWRGKGPSLHTTREPLAPRRACYSCFPCLFVFLKKHCSDFGSGQTQTNYCPTSEPETRLNNAPQRSQTASTRPFELWPSLKQRPSCLWSACSVGSDNMSERQYTQIKAEPVTSRQKWRARLAITGDAYKQPNTTVHLH